VLKDKKLRGIANKSWERYKLQLGKHVLIRIIIIIIVVIIIIIIMSLVTGLLFLVFLLLK